MNILPKLLYRVLVVNKCQKQKLKIPRIMYLLFELNSKCYIVMKLKNSKDEKYKDLKSGNFINTCKEMTLLKLN